MRRYLESCLCAPLDETSGWCYLGETSNTQRRSVNVSTVQNTSRALLKCSLYITVGKSYLFCNSQFFNGTSNCQALVTCSSRTITVICTNQRDCVAWCELNRTIGLRDEGEKAMEDQTETPVQVTHHQLGHDVISVIAASGALCLLVAACCIVDKVRNSKWWILHFPNKRKMSKCISDDFIEAMSTLPSPSLSKTNFANPPHSTPSPSLVSFEGQGEQTSVRKHSKKKLKVQFRSASLPTMVECSDSNDRRDQYEHTCSNTYENSNTLSLGDKVTVTPQACVNDNSMSSGLQYLPQSRIESSKL
ncbi:hypothetical protein ElyMa_005168800 [Elysia marginata]|uniref:Uncharacterized protein n=1 Tax=Elysia marginata TaxID=1093978 RepID=A0AAV4JVE2_9GAST|nr:hypothetical protein ElyMa_005168800 [Elysia marginata]